MVACSALTTPTRGAALWPGCKRWSVPLSERPAAELSHSSALCLHLSCPLIPPLPRHASDMGDARCAGAVQRAGGEVRQREAGSRAASNGG